MDRIRATSPTRVFSGKENAGILSRPLRILVAICASVTDACQTGSVRSRDLSIGPWGPSPRPVSPWQREQLFFHVASNTPSSSGGALGGVAVAAADRGTGAARVGPSSAADLALW